MSDKKLYVPNERFSGPRIFYRRYGVRAGFNLTNLLILLSLTLTTSSVILVAIFYRSLWTDFVYPTESFKYALIIGLTVFASATLFIISTCISTSGACARHSREYFDLSEKLRGEIYRLEESIINYRSDPGPNWFSTENPDDSNTPNNLIDVYDKFLEGRRSR